MHPREDAVDGARSAYMAHKQDKDLITVTKNVVKPFLFISIDSYNNLSFDLKFVQHIGNSRIIIQCHRCFPFV